MFPVLFPVMLEENGRRVNKALIFICFLQLLTWLQKSVTRVNTLEIWWFSSKNILPQNLMVKLCSSIQSRCFSWATCWITVLIAGVEHAVHLEHNPPLHHVRFVFTLSHTHSARSVLLRGSCSPSLLTLKGFTCNLAVCRTKKKKQKHTHRAAEEDAEGRSSCSGERRGRGELDRWHDRTYYSAVKIKHVRLL